MRGLGRNLCLISLFGLCVSSPILFGKHRPDLSQVHGSPDEAIGTEENDLDIDKEELIITRYLSTSNDHKFKDQRFHVQGWRWHTMSLVRDAHRLEKLALKLLSSYVDDSNEQIHAMDTAAEHVINFNMRGLHRIENEVFFPWLRTHLVKAATNNECTIEPRCDPNECFHQDDISVEDALTKVLDKIDTDRNSLSMLGKAVREQARIASSSKNTKQKRVEALNNIAQMSANLYSRTREIMEKEENLLVPFVAALIPAREQKSLNNRVIRKLGIFDSRLHLVGMYDAVAESNSAKEKELFAEYIPYLPRMMIPKWKRSLYDPKAGVLNLA